MNTSRPVCHGWVSRAEPLPPPPPAGEQKSTRLRRFARLTEPWHTLSATPIVAAGALAGLLLIMLTAPSLGRGEPPPARAKNLLVNGDFESGKTTPDGWQTVDGLTTFWVRDDDPRHGRVIKFDTDVLQTQGYDWWVKIAGGSSPKDAPKKIPSTDPNKYDTLAGLDGVFLWSDPIPVQKGRAYWLTIDVKGPGLLVWLVGYPEKPDTTFGADMAAFQEYLQDARRGKPLEKKRGHDPFIHKYVWKGQLAAGGSNEWKTYSRRQKPFRPTAVTPSVRFVRVLMLPTWPPATYYVDNVRLTEAEETHGGDGE